MSQFFTDLFNSIFTPGPTPSIVVATNVSFAALQLVLFGLLLATYSIHFAVLSFLCAGLWIAINWFVKELDASQALKDARKKAAEEKALGSDSDTDAETIIETGQTRSNEVEIVDHAGALKSRRGGSGNKSEHSTEDEWERVSENEKEKDK